MSESLSPLLRASDTDGQGGQSRRIISLPVSQVKVRRAPEFTGAMRTSRYPACAGPHYGRAVLCGGGMSAFDSKVAKSSAICWEDRDAFPASLEPNPAGSSARLTPPFVVRQTRRTDTRAVIVRFNEAVKPQDTDAIGALLTDETVYEDTEPVPDGGKIEGKTAVVAFWREWFAGSRDAKFENEEMIVSGDRAVVRWVSHRTQNGRPWRLRGVDIFTVRDGKIAEKLAYLEGRHGCCHRRSAAERTHGRMTLGAFDEWTRPAPYSSR